jgi:CTP:molybdopterin cytidylyltransferase MocA
VIGRTSHKPYVGIIAAAGRGSRYAAADPQALPKQLQRVNPYDANPLRRTVIGRLVDQLHSTGAVDRTLIITGSNHEALRGYFASWEVQTPLQSYGVRVDLQRNSHPEDILNSLEIGHDYLRDGEKAILVMSDLFMPDSNLRRAVERTLNLGLSPFIFAELARFGFKFGVMPKYDAACFVTSKLTTAMALESGLNSVGAIKKFLAGMVGLDRIKFRFALGSPYININTPRELERASKIAQG